MTHIVAIAGSPSDKSKSTALIRKVFLYLEEIGLTTQLISVSDLSPEELIFGTTLQDSQNLKNVTEHIERAAGVVIATPVYKAAYSGVLKAFLDLLPQKSLAGKTVLPIMTAGSDKHLLAIDYALKPVLSALGATQILNGFFVSDDKAKRDQFGLLSLDEETEHRLGEQVAMLVSSARLAAPQPKIAAAVY
ncbi:MAG: NADPH-dependent FMN reductase [Methylomonas sp.]